MEITIIPKNLSISNAAMDYGETHGTPKDEVTLDSILISIGQFGKFQILIFLLICLPMLFNAIFSITYVFTASAVTHRCNITECDTAESQYDETWTNFTIPTKGSSLDQCNRYASSTDVNTTTTVMSLRELDDRSVNIDTCQTDNFNQNQIERCPTDNLIFRDKEVTISNEVKAVNSILKPMWS